MMNFVQCQDEIIGRIHGEHKPNAPLRLRVKTWLNLARHQLVGLTHWKFLAVNATITLVGGTGEYSLGASDFVAINDQEVRLSGKKLFLIQEKDFSLLYPDSTVQGTPTGFTLNGYQKIQFWLIPSVGGTVNYEYHRRFTNDISADTDPHGLPEEFQSQMLDWAEAYAQAFAKRPDLAGVALNRMITSLQSALQINHEVVGMGVREIPPAQITAMFDQLTRVDRS
jgi:hypothetical protein